ncbi:uncharacterized protein LOC106670819 isoform X2 [Cimex lectularius]|uniref:Pentraxin (PTX) domain-containing protein n=1 Tax=Cimex lectularius TaxID=79782 RepID=A0A8I6S6Z4_CIMLE|nr:uncharacterized protein LOC106670819 isoform X2 [Cimex lectularius]
MGALDRIASLLLAVSCALAEWQPVDKGLGQGSPRTLGLLDPNHCDLYKVVMHQDQFYQYIQYKVHLPDMKEFTLCSWHKFYNHSTDHPLFSYALKDQPREIVSWVSNTDKSSFYQMAIGGHTIYRLNYPIKLFKWHHVCQSWNGKTGEWQVWIDSERAGRGFYNLLVGKKIKGGGLAMTGQEQSQYGGGFGVARKTSGLMGEVTLVQLYKAALTAGKAYNNHKHHHAHKFHHEGVEAEQALMMPGPEATPLPDGVTEFPFLRGMQLVPRLPVQELDVIRQRQQLDLMQQQQLQQQLQLQLSDVRSPFRLAKREQSKNDTEEPSSKTKRTTEFGVFPGIDLSGLYTGDGFMLGGGSLQNPFNLQLAEDDVEEKPPKKWNEPAEWEVRSIMALCSGCGEDPFRKATVLSWRETSKKLYAGALYVPAAQQCHHF